MARKKQEAQLQTELETQEQWDDMLGKEGLIVVDVYQEWCGPCTSMVANLRRLRNELAGDELLKFAVGKADAIESLEKYRGKCEPCFHLYAGGQLVNIVRGANSPLILQLIVDELNKEKKVLAGEAERQHFVDPVLAAQELARLAEKAEETLDEPDSQLKEVTVAIIKPNIFAKGNVNDVVQAISEKFEMLGKQEFTFTEDWVKEFYAHIESEPIFEELIEFMTSGPCMVMVLTNPSGENVCAEFREFIGHKDPTVAKQENPNCLRALYGDDVVKNGVHGSEPGEPAAKETTLVVSLMPDLVIPQRPPKPKLMQFMILIPPDLVAAATDKIKATLEQNEFRTIRCEEIPVTDEMFERIFDLMRKDDIEEFSRLHKVYAIGEPCVVIVVEKLNGIPAWIELFGPTDIAEAHANAPESLVAQIYPPEGVLKNYIYFATAHGRGRQDATYMLRHLDTVKPLAKPEFTIAAIKPDALLHRDDILQRIHEAGFQIVDRLERKLTPELVMRMYLNHQSQGYFSKVMEHLTSGPTMFLILYREEAISGWRSLIGPSDPVKAKAEAPDSIRAMIGQDVIKNAVFGADGANEAMQLLHLIWGENSEITEDGRLDKATPISSRPASRGGQQEAAAAPTPKPAEPAPTTPTHPEGVPSIPTLIANDKFDVKTDCESLHKAMEGSGADEDKMTSIMTRRSWQQRVAITKQFKEMYSADLDKAFKAETDGNYQDLLTSLTMSPAELAAYNLERAINRPGTDEECLIEIVCTSTHDLLQEVKAEYEKKYNMTLQAAVEGENVPAAFRDVIVSLLNKKVFPDTTDVEAAKKDAKHLHDEMAKGFSEGSHALTELLVERGNGQLQAIFDAFKQEAGKDIEEEINHSFSGDVKSAYLATVGTIQNKNVYFAKRLRASTEGLGTKDFMLIRILISRSEIDLESIKKEYERLFGSPLVKHVADDTSGDYKQGLIALITGNNPNQRGYAEVKAPSPVQSPSNTNLPRPPSIPSSPIPDSKPASKAPSRTNSKASIASGTGSKPAVKEAPTPPKPASPAMKEAPTPPKAASPVVKGAPTHSPANVSRRSSNASVKSQAKVPAPPITAAPPEPAAADEEEAKIVDG